MTHRIYNFCAGPCTLPLSVLEQAQAEFVDYQNSGMSILEMSHRGSYVMQVYQSSQSLMRELFKVPEEFSILFIQGGASLQFAMLPMNLLSNHQKGAYTLSGTWAKKAFNDGKVISDSYLAWDGTENNFTSMPESKDISLQDNTRYLHITSNETIGGIRYAEFPNVDVPLVADMSSDFMSRHIDWSKFDVVYAGVQKNLAPSGMAVVIIRNDILDESNQQLPSYLRYDLHQKNDSMYNTPAVFPMYMMDKTLQWMKNEGGISVIEASVVKKANVLYDVIDDLSDFYSTPVNLANRSLMNIVFRLPNEEMEKDFIAKAAKNGMEQLKGHRSVGGCRASIYNAMPIAGVEQLADFMRNYAKSNG